MWSHVRLKDFFIVFNKKKNPETCNIQKMRTFGDLVYSKEGLAGKERGGKLYHPHSRLARCCSKFSLLAYVACSVKFLSYGPLLIQF